MVDANATVDGRNLRDAAGRPPLSGDDQTAALRAVAGALS
jgi:hypothetical protein